tara:strand:- start:505 stop:897 length:393 start_codon:yes stop_codon:yes gene_type:complete
MPNKKAHLNKRQRQRRRESQAQAQEQQHQHYHVTKITETDIGWKFVFDLEEKNEPLILNIIKTAGMHLKDVQERQTSDMEDHFIGLEQYSNYCIKTGKFYDDYHQFLHEFFTDSKIIDDMVKFHNECRGN